MYNDALEPTFDRVHFWSGREFKGDFYGVWRKLFEACLRCVSALENFSPKTLTANCKWNFVSVLNLSTKII